MYVQWNLDLTNLHKYNKVSGITLTIFPAPVIVKILIYGKEP